MQCSRPANSGGTSAPCDCQIAEKRSLYEEASNKSYYHRDNAWQRKWISGKCDQDGHWESRVSSYSRAPSVTERRRDSLYSYAGRRGGCSLGPRPASGKPPTEGGADEDGEGILRTTTSARLTGASARRVALRCREASWSAGSGRAGEPIHRQGGGRTQVELSRLEVGLRLLGELAPESVEWEYLVRDERRRCFVGYLPRTTSAIRLKHLFTKIMQGTSWEQPCGRRGPIPRKTAWVVDSPCSCTYTYGGVDVRPVDFPLWMPEVLKHFMPLCGLPSVSQWPNSCNINLYENGDHSVGWHADDERLFEGRFRDCRVISLSLGEARRFQLWAEGGPLHEVVLRSGDLCTMEGLTQKYYLHRIPGDRSLVGPRINLTWRWIVRHGPDCKMNKRRSITLGNNSDPAQHISTKRS